MNMRINPNTTEVKNSPIKLQDFKCGHRIVGSLLYDTSDENLILRTRLGMHHNILTDKNKPTQLELPTPQYVVESQNDYHMLKYDGLWNDEQEYSINTIVKYKHKFYLSIEPSKNSKPSKLTDWDMFSYLPQTKVKEVAKFSMNNNMLNIDTITDGNMPITFSCDNTPDFIEFIEAKSTIYICRSGSFQVTYNITFTSPLAYCQTVLFTKDGDDVGINKQGSAFLSKSNTTNMVSINHTFVLTIDGVSNDNLTMETEGNGYSPEMSVKLTLVMRFEQDDINRSIGFYPDNSWMTIHEI